ncbi:MAG TPA: OsmC family protein [Actinomycetota bacterium]|nr:OsmC family protein [Actinomycetota bacterium]
MDGNRRLTLTANDDGTVTATSRTGHTITIDHEGERGLSPLELLLASLGSCSAVDLEILMRKQRDPIVPFEIEVVGEKEDARMQWLRVTYTVPAGTDPTKLERARSKTADDLCSVSRTLARGCPVEHVTELAG